MQTHTTSTLVLYGKNVQQRIESATKKNIERVTRKLDVLQKHCREVGRSYDDIEHTVLGHIWIAPDAMNPAEVVESCQDLAEIGFQHVIVNMPNVHEIEPIRIIGREIIPRVADL